MLSFHHHVIASLWAQDIHAEEFLQVFTLPVVAMFGKQCHQLRGGSVYADIISTQLLLLGYAIPAFFLCVYHPLKLGVKPLV